MNSLPRPDKEVVWLDVPMEEFTGVDVFYGDQHLLGKHKGCLQSQFPVGHVEPIIVYIMMIVLLIVIILVINVIDLNMSTGLPERGP